MYEFLTFGGAEHVRIASLPGMWNRTLTMSSAGKTFSCTGWKASVVLSWGGLGWGVLCCVVLCCVVLCCVVLCCVVLCCWYSHSMRHIYRSVGRWVRRISPPPFSKRISGFRSASLRLCRKRRRVRSRAVKRRLICSV